MSRDNQNKTQISTIEQLCFVSIDNWPIPIYDKSSISSSVWHCLMDLIWEQPSLLQLRIWPVMLTRISRCVIAFFWLLIMDTSYKILFDIFSTNQNQMNLKNPVLISDYDNYIMHVLLWCRVCNYNYMNSCFHDLYYPIKAKIFKNKPITSPFFLKYFFFYFF